MQALAKATPVTISSTLIVTPYAGYAGIKTASASGWFRGARMGSGNRISIVPEVLKVLRSRTAPNEKLDACCPAGVRAPAGFYLITAALIPPRWRSNEAAGIEPGLADVPGTD